MKTLLALFILLTFSCCAKAQDSLLKVKPVQTIGDNIKDFAVDNLGNIYLILPNNQIKKLNSSGDSVAVYNDVKRFGNIHSVDVTNPLKVLVYFMDFSTIVVLDRLLSVRNIIDLRKQNILQAKAIATSYDNNVWVYDELDSKLKKVDDNGTVLLESTDYRQALDAVPAPIAMYDRDGMLYLYDSAKGLFVFDYYGAQKNNLQLLHYADVQVIDKNTITARDSAHIILYKPATLQLYTFRAFSNQERFAKILFNGNQVFCLTKEGSLEVYQTVE